MGVFVKYKPLLLSPLGLIPMGLQPATAADLPVKAPTVQTFAPSWAGFYAGINFGLVADRSSETAFLPTGPMFPYCWAADCNFSNKQTATSLLGGFQLGYNFQSGQVVYGIETDIALSNAKKTTTGLWVGVPPIFGNWTAETGIRVLGTTRLRIGYAFDHALIYATGGVAYADMRNTFQAGSTANFNFSWSDTGWRVGYALGGGLEYEFTRDWSVKAEGIYYDLGRKDHVSIDQIAGTTGVGLTDHMTGIVARLGLNYRFH